MHLTFLKDVTEHIVSVLSFLHFWVSEGNYSTVLCNYSNLTYPIGIRPLGYGNSALLCSFIVLTSISSHGSL